MDDQLFSNFLVENLYLSHKINRMEGVTPPHVFDIISPMTPMPGMLLDFDSDKESPARILQF